MCDRQAQQSAQRGGPAQAPQAGEAHSRRRRRFPGLPSQVRHARVFVARCLTGTPDITTATLLASELVTNAITHSASGSPGGKFDVIVTIGSDWTRVEVGDRGGSGAPTAQQRDPYDIAEHGRGLDLVGALAHRWGTTEHPTIPGRLVWFELTWETPSSEAP